MSETAAVPGIGSRRRDLVQAARQTWVVWAGLFALGIGFGIVATSHGFGWWFAAVVSATVYAGSVEFILVGLLAAAAPVTTIALTTFLINSRHLFYGLSFPLHRVKGWRKAYSVFALTDEAYALLAGKDAASLSGGRILWTQLGLHLSWVSGALLGGVAGSTLLGDIEGLDFVLTALFVVLTIDAFRARPDKLTLALAVGSAVLAVLVVPGSMLLAAMSAFTCCLVIRHRIRKVTRAR